MSAKAMPPASGRIRPSDNIAFREKYKKQIEAQAKKRKAEEMI